MYPLAVVGQGRYDSYTTLYIDKSFTKDSINLYAYFTDTLGRTPKLDEKIKFIVKPDVVIVGKPLPPLIPTVSDSAIWASRGGFKETNYIVLENHGVLLGHGGNGRSLPTAIFPVIGGRAFISGALDESDGGRVIVNESDATIHVVNYGTISGGGGGGGSVGIAVYSTQPKEWGTSDATHWRAPLTHGPGGGGAPYGKGGIENHRADDLMDKSYFDPMPYHDTLINIIKSAKPNAAAFFVPLGGAKLDAYDLGDTDVTKYKITMPWDPDNILPYAMPLYFRVKSPIGSSHYNRYKSEIEGPDKHRIIFRKTYASIISKLGKLNNTTDTTFSITSPIYLGDAAGFYEPGKGGFVYTTHEENRNQYIPGYVCATGGTGGVIGRSGKASTPRDELVMYKNKVANDPTKGYDTRTVKSVESQLGLPVTVDFNMANLTGNAGVKPGGNAGYIYNGKVTLENKATAKTIGRIDVHSIKSLLTNIASVSSIKYFNLIRDMESTSGLTSVKHIEMRDYMSGSSPVILTSFSKSEWEFIHNSVGKITLTKGTHVPSGNWEYVAISEFGIIPPTPELTGLGLDVTVNGSKVTIDGIKHPVIYLSSDGTPSLLPIVLVVADPVNMSKIRGYMSSLNLHTSDYYIKKTYGE